MGRQQQGELRRPQPPFADRLHEQVDRALLGPAQQVPRRFVQRDPVDPPRRAVRRHAARRGALIGSGFPSIHPAIISPAD